MALPYARSTPEPALSLVCDPPLDWPATLAYLGARATPGVETVTRDGRYARAVRMRGHIGHLSVRAAPGGRRLVVSISRGLAPVRVPLRRRVRRLFDLDTDPRPVTTHLARDPLLAALVRRRPHLRLIGAMDGFELAVRAVLGQGVTVRGASLLAGRVAALAAEPLADGPFGLSRLPISVARLAETPVSRLRAIGLTRRRADCLLAMARATATGDLPELVAERRSSDPQGFIDRFTRLPGIGAWTAHYVAMRALGWPDAFPESDLGLRKAVGGLRPERLRAAAARWRPWRAYAAHYLWTSPLSTSTGTRS